MFEKLKKILGQSFAPLAELEVIKTYLGAQFSSDFQAFIDGKYKGDEAQSKRANGLSYLAKSIIDSKNRMKDDDMHRFFWEYIALPTIKPVYEISLIGEYNPKKFYIDALDYSSSILMIMLTPDVAKSAIPAKLVNNVLALNLRESARGGYFGNTPYWKLQRNPS